MRGTLWERIRRHAGERFETKTGKPFTYQIPGNFLRVIRDGEEVNRSLSRTNFMKAAASCPRTVRAKSRSGRGRRTRGRF